MLADIEKFIQRIPFFRLLLPVVAGILIRTYCHVGTFVSIIILVTGILLICLDFLSKNPGLQFRLRWLFAVGISFVLLACGIMLTGKALKYATFEYANEKQTYCCEILTAPTEKPKSVQCNVKIYHTESLNSKAIVYFQKDSAAFRLQPGDFVRVNTTFNKPKSFSNDFDYPRYLKYKGISGTTYVSSANWTKSDSVTLTHSIVRLASTCRDKLLTVYKNLSITGNEYAVLSAMTLGYKDVMPDELKQNFKTAGVIHILAISGLHVGFVYVMLTFLLSFFGKSTTSKVFTSVITILLLWFYAFVTGLSPSVVRASFMLTLIVFAGVLNRPSQTYNAVFLSAFCMLLYNPFYLYDAGFQLSYAAVLAIVFFQPRFYALLKVKNKFTGYLWGLLTVSFAAQLGTAPIVLFYFHQFPNYFWLTNILIIPIATIIIFLGFALLLIHWVPLLSNLLAFILSYLVKALNFITQSIAALPYATTDAIRFEAYHVLVFFFMLALITITITYRKYSALIATMSLLALTMAIDIIT